MKRFPISMLTAGLIGLTLVSTGQAQQPPNQFRDFGRITRRSGVSPYLNLNRGGLGALNYYNLVRPQIETQRGLSDLQSQLTDLEGQGRRAIGADPRIRSTGLSPRFFNYSHYYNFRRPGQVSGGSGSGFSSSAFGGGGLTSSTSSLRRSTR